VVQSSGHKPRLQDRPQRLLRHHQSLQQVSNLKKSLSPLFIFVNSGKSSVLIKYSCLITWGNEENSVLVLSMKCVFVLCLLTTLLCMLSTRFDVDFVYSSGGFPVHNLTTGLSYATIQEAVNANETLNGQTILVDSGVYNEQVILSKAVSLIGEDVNTTILDGTGLSTILEVQ